MTVYVDFLVGLLVLVVDIDCLRYFRVCVLILVVNLVIVGSTWYSSAASARILHVFHILISIGWFPRKRGDLVVLPMGVLHAVFLEFLVVLS